MPETIPGGYYIGTNGKPHDANGNPIELNIESKVVPAVEKPARVDDAEIKKAKSKGVK